MVRQEHTCLLHSPQHGMTSACMNLHRAEPTAIGTWPGAGAAYAVVPAWSSRHCWTLQSLCCHAQNKFTEFVGGTSAPTATTTRHLTSARATTLWVQRGSSCNSVRSALTKRPFTKPVGSAEPFSVSRFMCCVPPSTAQSASERKTKARMHKTIQQSRT